MALIVSSSFKAESAQKDGRFWVTETHVYDDGSSQMLSYLSDKATDNNKVMAQRAAAMNEAEQNKPPPDVARLKIEAALTAYAGGDFAAATTSLDDAKAAIAAKGGK